MSTWSVAFMLVYVVMIIATTGIWKHLRIKMIEAFQNCHQPLDLRQITDLGWRKLFFKVIASAATLYTLNIFFLILGEKILYAIGSMAICGIVTFVSFVFIERKRFLRAEQYIGASRSFHEIYPTSSNMQGFAYLWWGASTLNTRALQEVFHEAFRIKQWLKKESGINNIPPHAVYIKSVMEESLKELRVATASSNQTEALQAQLAILEIPRIGILTADQQEEEKAKIIVRLMKGSEKEQTSLREKSRNHEYIRIILEVVRLMRESPSSPAQESAT